jgi:hypothetical protein
MQLGASSCPLRFQASGERVQPACRSAPACACSRACGHRIVSAPRPARRRSVAIPARPPHAPGQAHIGFAGAKTSTAVILRCSPRDARASRASASLEGWPHVPWLSFETPRKRAAAQDEGWRCGPEMCFGLTCRHIRPCNDVGMRWPRAGASRSLPGGHIAASAATRAAAAGGRIVARAALPGQAGGRPPVTALHALQPDVRRQGAWIRLRFVLILQLCSVSGSCGTFAEHARGRHGEATLPGQAGGDRPRYRRGRRASQGRQTSVCWRKDQHCRHPEVLASRCESIACCGEPRRRGTRYNRF